MSMADSGQVDVCVAVCSLNRPKQLATLLEAICTQEFHKNSRPGISILVVDNGPDEATRHVCKCVGEKYSEVPIRYLVEPVRGISFARNTVLDHVPEGSDYLILIDDDEVPCSNWIDELIFSQKRYGVDIVRGPVFAEYEESVREWVKRRQYFGWPHAKMEDGEKLVKGATNNVLLNWKKLRHIELRFDERLARTGGEDAVFFNLLIHRHGLKICYAENARVYERISDKRASFYSLLRYHYRLGANRLLKKRLSHHEGCSFTYSVLLPHMWHGMRHIFTGLAGMIFILIPGAWRNGDVFDSFFRVARGIGHFAGLFGINYSYYGK